MKIKWTYSHSLTILFALSMLLYAYTKYTYKVYKHACMFIYISYKLLHNTIRFKLTINIRNNKIQNKISKNNQFINLAIYQ
jgi:hypothetical protein